MMARGLRQAQAERRWGGFGTAEDRTCCSANNPIADIGLDLHTMRMGGLSTGLTLLVCLPVCLSTGAPQSEGKAFAPYDLRIGSDYFVGAAPVDTEKWVTSADHPESTYGRFEAGEVTIAFDITTNGHVVNCRVTKSSAISRFDNVPCKLLMRRARFKPQQDAQAIQPGARGQMRFRFDEVN
ncbi:MULTISPECIES: energy transducer TonB [Sphingomonadales]|uniref:energy transducer TonB family protein n=3 Tax=Pseudomonadota TaxID=1224 RepID=UPI0009BFB8CC|nr:energy transducer TonB [Blastomonas sp.]